MQRSGCAPCALRLLLSRRTRLVCKEVFETNCALWSGVQTEEMASALSRFRRALALPESSDGSTVSRRFDSQRLLGSYRSEAGTWQDRVSHVPPHLSCVAGRNRSTRGRTAETHATRACFDHHGSVWQCLGPSQAQGQSAHCATPLAKACQSRGLHSINKGNCEPVPLIGQFWTVVTSAQLPVTLGLRWLRGPIRTE
jgi:hypothetical protein